MASDKRIEKVMPCESTGIVIYHSQNVVVVLILNCSGIWDGASSCIKSVSKSSIVASIRELGKFVT